LRPFTGTVENIRGVIAEMLLKIPPSKLVLEYKPTMNGEDVAASDEQLLGEFVTAKLFKQFSEDEKTALSAFLEGLGQILTSGIDSADASDPGDPYSLEIKKSAGASVANSAKAPTTGAAAAPAPVKGPVPIRAGGA
jgi:hypothetical protein